MTIVVNDVGHDSTVVVLDNTAARLAASRRVNGFDALRMNSTTVPIPPAIIQERNVFMKPHRRLYGGEIF